MSRRPFNVNGGPPELSEHPEKSIYEPFYLASGSKKDKRSPSPFLGLVGLAQPSLQISLAQDVFFLHPSGDGSPTDDEIVTGNVTLWLPKARTLRHLTVRLVGRYDIGWNDSSPYESGVCLERTVSLLQEGEEVSLEKGEHVFEFIIIVPANSACYERCQYGRVRHSITAKAKGLGLGGQDLMSLERPLFLVINPGLEDASKPPPPLHLKFEGSLDEIGPYSCAMDSQFLMVGGLLLFRLSLLFPPIDLLIYSIKVKIVQQFTLRSPIDRSHTSTPPPSPQTVFILDSTHPPNNAKVQDDGRGPRSGSQTPRNGPLKALKKDELWKLTHLARLPNDNHIRPSTPEGTDSPISVSHTIMMELTYRPMTEEESNPPPFDAEKLKGKGKDKNLPEPERRKVVMSKPLDLFSCCCFLDSLTLPVYSITDPNPTPLDSEMQLPCVCGMGLKRLVEKHANALLIEGEDTTIEYVAPPKPDGILPSPSAERPAVLWDDSDNPPLTPTEENERGRSTSRRVSPSASREPSGSRSRGFFRVGSSSDRLFNMAGWRQPSSSAHSHGSGGHSESRGRTGRGELSPDVSRASSRVNLSSLAPGEATIDETAVADLSLHPTGSRASSRGRSGPAALSSSPSGSRPGSRSHSRRRGIFSFGGGGDDD